MRTLLALAALLLLAAAAPTRDWSAVTRAEPTGAFLIGNPAARVKLVEYASYTCPHCAAFQAESEAVLRRQWIRSGSTSLEYRALVRDRLDLAAAVVARCAGPAGFAAASAALYAEQPRWLPRGAEFQETNAARIGTYPPLAQLRAYADGAGLTAIGRAQGLSDARLDACFADQAGVDRIVALAAARPDGVLSTPTFFLNGRRLPSATWAELAPVLRRAGAR